MSREQQQSSVRKLVWRTIIITLIVGIILIAATKVLPVVIAKLTERLGEFMEHLEGLKIL